MGGTGFSPPYLNPKAPPAPFTEDVAVKMDHKVYTVPAKTAGKFLQSMSKRWQKPATVFCSRDLEDGLAAFVKSELAKGVVPNDDALRAKARDLLGVQETAADDVLLLEKFKSLHGIGSPMNLLDLNPGSNSDNNSDLSVTNVWPGAGQMHDFTLPDFNDDVDMLAGFDMDLGAKDLTTPFGAGAGAGPDFGLGPDGGAALMGMDMLGLDMSPGHESLTTQSPSNLGPVTQSLGIREGSSGVGTGTSEMKEGAMRDYAELHRVSAATASPLRRKASEKLAQKAGSAFNSRESLYLD